MTKKPSKQLEHRLLDLSYRLGIREPAKGCYGTYALTRTDIAAVREACAWICKLRTAERTETSE